MKKKMHPVMVIVGTICVLILVVAAMVAVILDSRSPNPILGIFRTEPTETTGDTQAPTDGTAEVPEETKAPTYGPEKPTQGPEKPTDPPVKPEDPTVRPSNPTVTPNTPTEPSAPPVTPNDPSVEPEDPADTPVTPPEDPADTPVTPPEIRPPEVVIPPSVDPDTGKESISFPCRVPDYDLVIEKLAPYSGMFVENGANVPVDSVAMLQIHNDGDFPVEYTQICVQFGQDSLLFDISALPVGESLVVQEKAGKALPEGTATTVTAMVVQRAQMEMSENKVSVTDNGDNTLTVTNLTGETIPTVRIFYKYYMQNEGLFVGGIAFTVRITRLGPGASVTIQPSHYTSQTGRVVMVLTYDSEV